MNAGIGKYYGAYPFEVLSICDLLPIMIYHRSICDLLAIIYDHMRSIS